MKPKAFIQRLKDLKIRRFEKNDYAKSIGGGTGLTGNLLDDWVTVVTQDEYTKYEDIPEGVQRKSENLGWRRVPDTLVATRYADMSVIAVSGIHGVIVKDGILMPPDPDDSVAS